MDIYFEKFNIGELQFEHGGVFEIFGTTSSTTLNELADILDEFYAVKEEYESRKQNSPNIKIAIELWLNEIKVLVKEPYGNYEGDPVYTNFVRIGYWDTLMGKNLLLGDYYDVIERKSISNGGVLDLKAAMESFHGLARGVAYAHKIDGFKRELEELSKTENSYEKTRAAGINESMQEVHENLIRFDNSAQKYLLLQELGIIDLINKRYRFTSNAKKAALLAYITDTRTAKPFENILSAIYNKNFESDYYRVKEKNELMINHILAIVGIERILP